ncbi:MAG: hypothetical protein NTV87_00650 [Ignavibacteriae bacterium]|nr:hypothetical protein [Ignavibacteriota bacterium]
MEELILKLKSLGFTEYESKVFLAVLQGRLMSASEIAEAARIRRTDVYNILRRFVEKGYCNEIETNSVIKFELVDPDYIFDKIEGRIHAIRDKEIKSLKDAFIQIKPMYRSKHNGEEKIVNVELIRGYNQHREIKFIDIFKKAKKEILFMTRPEYFVSGDVDRIAVNFIKKGGVIRSVYEAGNSFRLKTKKGWTEGTTEDLVKTVEFFGKYGEQVRLIQEKVPNITIFDRETVFMNINDKTVPKHNEADIIIRSSNFADSMSLVFESFWNRAYTINEFKKELKKKHKQ